MKLYGITKHHEVIELEATKLSRKGHDWQYQTKPTEELDGLTESFWRTSLQFLWSWQINNGTFFRSKRRALLTAYQLAQQQADEFEKTMDRLRDQAANNYREYWRTFGRK